MPIVDRRSFGGRFPVSENSQRLANYRYLEVQLMEMIGGWSHTTPDLAYKAAFGYQVYDHAQAASMLGVMATVGSLEVHPAASNVIPGQALVSLDARHALDAAGVRAGPRSARRSHQGRRS